jgi:hypothetical protein
VSEDICAQALSEEICVEAQKEEPGHRLSAHSSTINHGPYFSSSCAYDDRKHNFDSSTRCLAESSENDLGLSEFHIRKAKFSRLQTKWPFKTPREYSRVSRKSRFTGNPKTTVNFHFLFQRKRNSKQERISQMAEKQAKERGPESAFSGSRVSVHLTSAPLHRRFADLRRRHVLVST